MASGVGRKGTLEEDMNTVFPSLTEGLSGDRGQGRPLENNSGLNEFNAFVKLFPYNSSMKFKK